MDPKSITSCSQFTEDHYAYFAQTKELTLIFLDRIAEIAAYRDGSENIIQFLARLALTGSWVQGPIQVEIISMGAFRSQLDFRRHAGNTPELLKRTYLKTSCSEFLSIDDPRYYRPFTSHKRPYGQHKSVLFVVDERSRELCNIPAPFASAKMRLVQARPVAALELPQLSPQLKRDLEKRRIKPTVFGLDEPPTVPQGRRTSPLPSPLNPSALKKPDR